MWKDNTIRKLFDIDYPLVQAGMVWASGWRLAAAVSNAGGLGVLGAGSMYPEVLDLHLEKLKAATRKPFGVNLPLLYADVPAHLEVIKKHGVGIVFTSAGNPAVHTPRLKDEGIKVVHVVANRRFAEKAQESGCDAVVAEGMEAGGHIGREENTTMVLVPLICSAVDIPVIAAGGIATGRQMLAAMALGADGVQVGSRFVASDEASSHDLFKQAVVQAGDGDTVLTLKELVPVRMMRNAFYEQLKTAYQRHATRDEFLQLLGRARPKRGMFEGDMVEGELQIGQVAALIHEIKPAGDIVREIVSDYQQALRQLG